MAAADDAISLRLPDALQAAGDAAFLWDLQSDAICWSGRLDGIALDPAAALTTGREFARAIYAEDLPGRRSRLAEHCRDDTPFRCEYRLPDGSGGFVWVEERGRVERNAQGHLQSLLGVLRVRSGSAEIEPRRPDLGCDALTGHLTRTRLRQAIDRIAAVNARTGVSGAFLAVAIDGFAGLRARAGAAAGDALLVEFGRRLDLTLRVSDAVGRLGPDRFGIMLAHCPADQTDAAVGRIAEALTASPVETAAGPLAATVSVGIATCAKHEGADALIAAAEAALADAVSNGGDCRRHYRPTTRQRMAARRDRAAGAGVREALRDGLLSFAYQPVVSALTGKVDYFECLLRLRGADGQLVSGGELVKQSEKLGLIGLIDRFALDEAARELAAHPEVSLGLNVSALTAGDRRWLRTLTALLRNRPDWGRRLVIEITETATLDDLDESARFVDALRDAGCRVALDDFGAGHTSILHLQRLAIDTVKIDGSLVRDLAAKPDNQVFIRHLLGLARGFGFETLAECVETEEEAAILRAAGVGYLQGYHIGRPSPERTWLNGQAAPRPLELVSAR